MEYGLSDFEGRPVNRNANTFSGTPILAEKGGYKHFMLKEISSSRDRSAIRRWAEWGRRRAGFPG